MIKKIKETAKIAAIQTAILFFSLCLLIIAVEMHYRYKYSFKLPKNDYETVTWGIPTKKNNLGYRGQDFEIRAFDRTDHSIILVLGDSLTWGAGLDEKERYSDLLQTYLRSENPGLKVTVLNFGIRYGATTKQRDILRSYYKQIEPDLVIVGFCINDPQEKFQNYSKEREEYFSKIKPLLSFLKHYKMKGTHQLVSQVYENVLTVAKKIPRWQDALDRAYDQDSADWHRFEDALKEIAVMSKEVTPNPPVFISLNQGASNLAPTDYNKPDPVLNNYFLRWYHQAESAAKKHGFIAVNCEEEFKAQLKDHVMAVVPGEDGHPTAEMNKIYAQKLVSVMKDNA